MPTSDLWISQRTLTGWSQPTPLGALINTEADEDCPVLAADGTIYFSSSRPGPNASPGGIFRAKSAGGAFAEPERLGHHAEALTEFVLRGLGCEEDVVARELARARERA